MSLVIFGTLCLIITAVCNVFPCNFCRNICDNLGRHTFFKVQFFLIVLNHLFFVYCKYFAACLLEFIMKDLKGCVAVHRVSTSGKIRKVLGNFRKLGKPARESVKNSGIFEFE